MERVIKEIMSPSKQYKVQVIKRKDGLFTTEVYMRQEYYGYNYWSPVIKGVSLIETEQSAVMLAMDHLRVYPDEVLAFQAL